MRSAIIAAAFAATALAVPYVKRDVVTHTAVDMTYVTTWVTVTAGSQPTEDSNNKVQHYGHAPKKPGWWGKPHNHQHQEPTTVNHPEPKPTTVNHPEPKPTTVNHPEPEPTTTGWSEPKPKPEPTTKKQPKPEPTTTGWSKPSPTEPTHQRSAPASSPTDYAQKAVLHHNVHRANHSAPDVSWDEGLVASARQVAESCVYAHNTAAMGGGYGQNIAAGVAADNITAIITDLFYNAEVGWYDGMYGEAQPDMSNFEHWGHFSQIVWKATTHIGCYTQDCSSKGLQNVGSNVNPYFTVCNYQSVGNVANNYGTNVGKPLGHPTVYWNYGL